MTGGSFGVTTIGTFFRQLPSFPRAHQPRTASICALYYFVCLGFVVTLFHKDISVHFHRLHASLALERVFHPEQSIFRTTSGQYDLSCAVEKLGVGAWVGSEPKFWQPSRCLVRAFHAKSAKDVLQRVPILVLGDSTQQGLYSEICHGILSDYNFSSQYCDTGLVTFLRVDTLQEAREKYIKNIWEILSGDDKNRTLIVNFGAHESKSLRKVCPNPLASNYLDHFHLLGNRVVTEWKSPTDAFDDLRNSSMDPLIRGCTLRDTSDAYLGKFIDFVTELRNMGYQGRVIWRTTQINFGFDFVGAENFFKFRVNEAFVKARSRLSDLDVQILDVERLTGTRPETFEWQLTNHFYCQCESDCSCALVEECWAYVSSCALHARGRCRSTSCEPLRSSRHDNGAPNRVIAQLLLNAIDGVDTRFIGKGSCSVVFNESLLQGTHQGKAIDSATYVIRDGRPYSAGASVNPTDVGSRTDIYFIFETSYDADDMYSKMQDQKILVLVLHDNARDATELLAHHGRKQWMYESAQPYTNFVLDEFPPGANSDSDSLRVRQLFGTGDGKLLSLCSSVDYFGWYQHD